MTLYEVLRGRLGVLILVTLLPPSLFPGEDSKPDWERSLYLGGGIAVPGGSLKQSMFTSGLVRLGYGHRFSRYFQADLGLDAVVRGARVDIRQQTLVGEVQVHDYEYLIPFGGRAILPLRRRAELFGGGGATYMRYQEEADLPSGVTVMSSGMSYVYVDCPSCNVRNGWGYYGTAGGNVALDRRNRVWLGLEVRLIRGKTSGQSLGSGSGFESRDGWLNITMNITYRF